MKYDVDLTDLDSIDDPAVMKKFLPRLEAAMVTKTEDINEFVVDQIREIGMCSKIACHACLRQVNANYNTNPVTAFSPEIFTVRKKKHFRLLAYERHFKKNIKIPRLACLQGMVY